MNNIILSAEALPARIITPALYDEFIAYIDRGEATTKAYIKNLRQFAAWVNYAGVKQPTRADIVAYRDHLAAEHPAIELDGATGWRYRKDKAGNNYTLKCKPNTIKQYLQSVCAFFRWAAACGYYPNIAENIHAPRIKQDIHRKEALTAAEVLKIEQSITQHTKQRAAEAAKCAKDNQGRAKRATEQGKRLYAMYLLAVNCGLRTIELHRANICDLEQKDGNTYLYIQGKGHAEADTKKTLAPAVRDAIYDYLESRTDAKTQSSPLFIGTGNRSKGQRIATTTISTMLKGALRDAGYNSDRLTAHSLRHTAGTNVQQVTGNLYLTQQYMRHANPATTEIYLHIDTQKQEADIAARLYDYYHGADKEADTLERVIAALTPGKREALAKIAAAMA